MDVPPPSPESPGRLASDAGLRETIYAHMYAIARHQMNSECRGHTLSATALVHEAYLCMGKDAGARSYGRAAFLNAAAEAMRRILIEHARARGRIKRGGGAARIPLDAIGDVADLDAFDRGGAESVFAFDEALRRLEAHQPDVGEVVRLRFFAGLTVPETAAALGVSDRTINNRWAYARAWLARELQRGADGQAGPAAAATPAT